MQYAGTTLIIVLSITLILAVCVLVFGVGRFVYGIAHYYLRERKPARYFRHAEFGVFTSDGDLWSCELHRESRALRLLIAGTKDEPNERLLTQAKSILERFAAVEQRAIEFLRNREKELCATTLNFYCLDITNVQRPKDFTFEFIDPRDDSLVWRVEFVAGEPKRTGFDD